jgi:hypothetical protein
MKRILTVGKIEKGKKTQIVSLEAARKMLFDEATRAVKPSGRLQIRQLDRICARTGIPWAVINSEAQKEGL